MRSIVVLYVWHNVTRIWNMRQSSSGDAGTPIASALRHIASKLIKHNASHTFQFIRIFLFSLSRTLVIFFFLLVPAVRRRSLINRKTSRRAQSKLQTYGRFDALVARQFRISLLNLWWAPMHQCVCLVQMRYVCCCHQRVIISAAWEIGKRLFVCQ